MTVNKNDFVEIEFTGKLSDTGEVFDTNIETVAKDAGLEAKGVKPFVMSVGHKMLPVGFDKDLEGKEIGTDYTVEVNPEEGFGKRNPQMVRMIPTKMFYEQQINPQRGMQLSLDGQLVKVLSSDRGRTLVDFNNPLAGKKIIYEYKINRKVEDEKEKIDALQDFLFRKTFEFEKKDDTIVFKVNKDFEQFVKMLSNKFEEIVGLKTDAEIVDSQAAQKTSDNQSPEAKEN